jgi:tripartite-type tricarboxylate transporter receptor subunit TctC
MKRCVRGLAALVLPLLAGVTAQAQEGKSWPQGQVAIVVPFGAGSTPDILARMVAEKLQEMYGQPVIVQNRPGNSGAIGMEAVRQSKPDGYTLMTSALGGTIIAPALNKNIPYKPADFTHIAYLGGPPAALTAHKDFPARTLQELVAQARAAKEALPYGVSGLGTHTHLVGELLQQRANFKMEAIAYRGGAQSTTDLLGGHIPVGSIPLVSVSEHIRSGALRGLAVTAPQRLESFPDLPTFAELGYPELTGTTWFGISGPPGMPKDLADRLNADIRKAMQSASVKDFYRRETIVAADYDVASFNAFFADEVKKWHAVVAASGLKMQ